MCGKVFGVGLNRTGTKTLAACLSRWSACHRSFDAAAFDWWHAGNVGQMVNTARAFQTFEDWPWAIAYADLDAAFPNAQYILTRRRTADEWFGSLCRHAERTGPTRFRKAVYGHEMPHAFRAHHISVYERHLEDVRRRFASREGRFLEVCWDEGDGWANLAKFLSMDEPDEPLPHVTVGTRAREWIASSYSQGGANSRRQDSAWGIAKRIRNS